jgi:predicted membrane metal-binding protein
MSVRFHHKHPLAFTACFLVLGAILVKQLIFFIAALGILLFLTKRLCWREYILSGLALALGFLSFNYQFKEYKNAQRALQNNYPIQVFVTAQSRNAKGLQIKALVKAYYKEGTWKVTPNYEVEWWQKEVLNIPPGSLIAIKGGKLKTPQKRQYSFLFDDEAYHLGQKKLGRLKLQNAQIYGLRCDSNSLEYKRFQYKHDILVRLEEVLSPRAHALFAGLILGDKSLLEQETKNSFSNTGAMHVLAVSGLHVGIIMQLLLFLLSRFSKFI